VNRPQDLIAQFHRLTATDGAAETDRFSHRLETGKTFREIPFLAPDHKSQRSVPGADIAPGDGSVEKTEISFL
jgi:hypothetical protein